jgi:hypothetical protein
MRGKHGKRQKMYAIGGGGEPLLLATPAALDYTFYEMSRRDEWRRVLAVEVRRWSSKTCEQLLSELLELQVYEVELDSKKYQVEVEILENTAQYLHIRVAVDDGSLPASIIPATETFIAAKPQPTN